jgi:cytochrome oxidase assembly protein ShyY1
VIYVNRGWISRTTTSWDRPEGKVTLQGLVTETEPGSSFSPPNDIQKRKFFWFEEKALKESLQPSNRIDANGIARFRAQRHFVMVDAIENEIDMKGTGPFPKLPQIINTHYAQPITHLTYAFTW